MWKRYYVKMKHLEFAGITEYSVPLTTSNHLNYCEISEMEKKIEIETGFIENDVLKL